MPLPESMTVPRTWNLVAPGYAVEIAPTFSRFAEDALELAHLVPGERVLDVATGPGTLALAAVAAGARVSAIDFAPKMIDELGARARRARLPEIDARVADATALPFGEGAFDAVFSMFALNLVARRGAAFGEIHRVLRKGGRAVVGTPASMTKAPAFADVRDILRRALPDLDLSLDLPLSESADLKSEMSDAGFADVRVEPITRSFTYPSVKALWEVASRAGAPLVLARETMPEQRWACVSGEIVRGLEQRFGRGPQTIDVAVNLAHARK
jgi:SAM-dependent methyltransferase